MAINATPGLTPASAPAEQAGQYLMFTLGSETFACPIHSIREIIECPAMTAIPLSPAFLRGVINLRGAVVPVIDLSVRLGMDPIDGVEQNVIVVVSVGNITAGLLVDAVSDILTVSQDEIQPPPDVGAEPSARCIDALLLVEGKLIRVLDLKVLLPNESRDAA